MPRLERYSRAEVRRIHEALRRAFRAAGHGSIRRTEKALGLYKGYFAYHRQREALDVGVLLATLHLLDIDFGNFFRETLRAPGAPVPEDVALDERIRGRESLERQLRVSVRPPS